MTKDEAIEILQDDAYMLYEDDSPYNRQAYDMAIESLKQNQWIPCEKELPEPYEDVIVCSDIGNIEIAHGDYMDYLDGGWDWLTSGWKFGEVIAWMPLPKAYEGR